MVVAVVMVVVLVKVVVVFRVKWGDGGAVVEGE